MKKKNKLTGRGGAGRGQGRKSKYGEPTVLVRIPQSLVSEVDKMINERFKA